MRVAMVSETPVARLIAFCPPLVMAMDRIASRFWRGWAEQAGREDDLSLFVLH